MDGDRAQYDNGNYVTQMGANGFKVHEIFDVRVY